MILQFDITMTVVLVNDDSHLGLYTSLVTVVCPALVMAYRVSTQYCTTHTRLVVNDLARVFLP
jgi:hypothetical protein